MKHPRLRDAPSIDQQKGKARRGSRGKREKWLPEGKAAGLAAGLAAGSQGTAEGQGSR